MNDKKILTQLEELLRKYPAILVAYFYGSQITKQAVKNSDLDLAIMTNNPSKIDYTDLYYKISQIITSHEVDLRIVTPANSPTYLFQVLKNGQRIYELDAKDRVRFEAQVMKNFYDSQHIRNIYNSYLKQAF